MNSVPTSAVPLPAVSIVGVGHHLPARVVGNDELCQKLDPAQTITPDWIEEKLVSASAVLQTRKTPRGGSQWPQLSRRWRWRKSPPSN